jgi:glutaredoxin 3
MIGPPSVQRTDCAPVRSVHIDDAGGIMARATVYTRPFCPYCDRALALLRRKGVEIEEIEAGFDARLKAEMVSRSGGRTTFPQIFIAGQHVGGCDDLHALDDRGGLDPLLAQS